MTMKKKGEYGVVSINSAPETATDIGRSVGEGKIFGCAVASQFQVRLGVVQRNSN
jgi:hypothetical protein